MKMAIVGCEASGKTVFMGALADYYGRDAANNPTRLKLTPENAAANKFERLMFRQMRCQHQWPPATPPERNVEIKWSLRKGTEPKASIDLLEFGGETYREAFRGEQAEHLSDSAAELLKYLGDTDFFVVLVSIKALLADPSTATDEEFGRETEALWVTRGILEFIRKNKPNAGLVIGLTQADKYRVELGEAGGPKRFFAERWPTVASLAADVPVVDVASVSKTDEAGNPAEGYRTHGILPVMRIFSKHCFGSEDALETGLISDQAPVTGDVPPRSNPLLTENAPAAAVNPAKAVAAPTPAEKKSSVVFLSSLVILCAIAAGLAWNVSRKPPAAQIVPATVTNVVEKVVKVPVTNVVSRLVKVKVTNTVEKVVHVPVTNIVKEIVKVQVTNTVEKVVKVQVTNTVEKIVKVEKVVTNVVEKAARKAALPKVKPSAVTTSVTPTNAVKKSEAALQNQIPAGYRIWTDYNGRRIVAKWISVAIDKSGITLLTRSNRKIDAVLWKFSPEDQDYIRAEIKRHSYRGELMSDGEWVRSPLLKKQ